MDNAHHDHRGMGQRPAKRRTASSTQFRPLYIGQWIRALHKRPRDVSKGTGINEGYISQLISGEKKNPSGAKLALIAEYLDIPLGYLYRPPPGQEFLEEAATLDPAILSRLRPPTN